jgi:hypothetical protein
MNQTQISVLILLITTATAVLSYGQNQHNGGSAKQIALVVGTYQFQSSIGDPPRQASMRIDSAGNLRMDIIDTLGNNFTEVAKISEVNNTGYLSDKGGDYLLIGASWRTYQNGREIPNGSGTGNYAAILKGSQITDFDVSSYVFRRASAGDPVSRVPANRPPEDSGSANSGGQSNDSQPPGSAKALLAAMYKTAPNASYSDVDCTHFVARALENAGFTIGAREQTRIFMSDIYPGPDLLSLIRAGDARVGGAPVALIQSGQATPVLDIRLLAAGDVVQYWYFEGGFLKGHTGIVEKTDGTGQIMLYGSHRSLGGVGSAPINMATKPFKWGARPIR